MLLAHPLDDHRTHAGCAEPSPGPRSLLARLGAAVLREIRIRRSLRELDSLGDAMLHDLGITRGGLEDVVRHGRPRDHRPVGSTGVACSNVQTESLAHLAEWR